MNIDYTNRPDRIQTPLEVLPAEGHLVQPAGLTHFQQTEFWWELKLAVEVADRRNQPTIRQVPPDLLEPLLGRMVGEPHWILTQCYTGELVEQEEDRICPNCGCRMNVHSRPSKQLQHLPMGSMKSVISLERTRYTCPNETCEVRTVLPSIPFATDNHRITIPLQKFIEDLCTYGLTHKAVQDMTGVDRHLIKTIDKRRLVRTYTDIKDGRMVLKKPEQQATVLGIDEFKLHGGHEFATLIMDMDTGHVLWLQHGKKKQVVYDFIEHVGLEWMENVEAVCSDMNADFAAAFLEKCPHLEIVYDRFHIVKNFNEMVIGEIRKDAYRKLQEEGDLEAARRLKGSKYILTSKRSTLQRKDREAEEGRVLREGSDLFQSPEIRRTGGKEAWYDQLLERNELLFAADYVKEMLGSAYTQMDRTVMQADVLEIIAVCRATENVHFGRFANLLENHLDGIISHAEYPRSSGKVEGTNNRIKTIRRQAYGYRDDDYFFLRIIDATRHPRSRMWQTGQRTV